MHPVHGLMVCTFISAAQCLYSNNSSPTCSLTTVYIQCPTIRQKQLIGMMCESFLQGQQQDVDPSYFIQQNRRTTFVIVLCYLLFMTADQASFDKSICAYDLLCLYNSVCNSVSQKYSQITTGLNILQLHWKKIQPHKLNIAHSFPSRIIIICNQSISPGLLQILSAGECSVFTL